ncbi:DUF2199 domain-containing protein [Flavobacterium sp. UBA4197]|uniref:DUF2199 domain-containing protein n=1 Tax=Flavobacterium sp. UBA4197 TaxID=1946546 RepID=UPI0025802955|nr:DUF2199 domain-containing protein [Flavobacterium sp. UBA4197]
MDNSIKYTCECCGKSHESWPALTFISPDNYNCLPQQDKDNIAELKSDTCIINYPDQIDRFIRCILIQTVTDHCEDLDYGLWVSLSDKSFQDYMENFDDQNHETQYFGWLCNNIPGYEFSESIPTTVYTKKGNQRPEIVPHKNFDHPFVRDYYNGITKKEAERRIKTMLQKIEDHQPELKVTRSWWKFWK